MHYKWFLYAGLAAVGIYVFTTILGGLLYPNYSHISQHISELVGSHAPTRALLNPMYLLYNLLLIAFAYGLNKQWNNWQTKLGVLFLFILGVVSILMWWFPMDTRGYPVTQRGIIHIILAAIESLSTVVATFLFGFGLRKKEDTLSKTSFITGFLLLITGPFAGITAAQNSQYMGLSERITIGLFLLWVVVFSSIMLKKKE